LSSESLLILAPWLPPSRQLSRGLKNFEFAGS